MTRPLREIIEEARRTAKILHDAKGISSFKYDEILALADAAERSLATTQPFVPCSHTYTKPYDESNVLCMNCAAILPTPPGAAR